MIEPLAILFFVHAYPPWGGRLRRGILIRVTSSIPPVEVCVAQPKVTK